MIKVTRHNKQETFWVNENLIEFMEEAPDTILSMSTGRKINVAESAEEIVRRIERARDRLLIRRDMDGEILE